MGMRFIVALTIQLLSDAAMAQQQHRTFMDANGREVGRSVTDTKGNTVFYDSMGRTTGRSVNNGNSTIVYDSMGRQTGSIRK
jgi:hypothetical protein